MYPLGYGFILSLNKTAYIEPSIVMVSLNNYTDLHGWWRPLNLNNHQLSHAEQIVVNLSWIEVLAPGKFEWNIRYN